MRNSIYNIAFDFFHKQLQTFICIDLHIRKELQSSIFTRGSSCLVILIWG